MYGVFLQSKWKLSLRFFVLSLFLVVGCSKIPQISNPPTHSDLVIWMGRGSCMENCPAYEITITGDGTVTFTGWLNVEVLGTRSATISQNEIEQLIAEFNNANFFELDKIQSETRDCPSTGISITLEGKSKRYQDYRLCSKETLPYEKKIQRLEMKIDELSNSQQWLGDSAVKALRNLWQ